MKRFAFIVSPTSIKRLREVWRATRLIPDFILNSSLKYISHFRILEIKVRSVQGKEIQGYLIIEKETSPDRIMAAGHTAQRLGASILGLEGYPSLSEEQWQGLAKNLKIPFVNGNTFTAWSVFEALYRTAKLKNIDLKKSTLAITDATSPIGNLCARKLSAYVAKIIVSGREIDKLKNLQSQIISLNSGSGMTPEVIIEEDAGQAFKDAHIVVSQAEAWEIPLNLKPPDQNIWCGGKAGLIKLPYPVRLNPGIKIFGALQNLWWGKAKNIIWASLAEIMLLTFEERFTSYSSLENINLDKLEQIADIAIQHGFEVLV